MACGVVAEGAETTEDMQLLKAVGADMVQGYFVAKPLPVNDVMPWADDWRRRNTPPAMA